MSKKRKIERKKKKREEIAKQRVLARREQIRKQRKKELEEKNKYEFEYELKNGKPKPYIKNQSSEEIAKKDKAIIDQIEKNYKILEELEKQHLKDKSKDKKNKIKIKGYKKLSIQERVKLHKEGKREITLYPGDTITSYDVKEI